MPARRVTQLPVGAYYFRAAYREARTEEERAAVFEALVQDHEDLRTWFRQTFHFEPPVFVESRLEYQARRRDAGGIGNAAAGQIIPHSFASASTAPGALAAPGALPPVVI